MGGSDRGTGLIAPVTDRRVAVTLGWLSLATLVVLSGCTTGVNVTDSTTMIGAQGTNSPVTGTATTAGDGTASSSPTASPVPTASSTAGSSTATPASPTPTAAATQSATATPGGENLTQAEARQVFVSTVESEGITVNRLELADSVWMLTYTTGSTSWGGFADEMASITLAYCGLFDRGLPMGFEGSDMLEMTVLDESGAIGGWYVDPFRWCEPYLDGELTERELMAEVFGTLRIDESG